jgi:alkylation response protein AidB-like acyl-CoA dehydrogenase
VLLNPTPDQEFFRATTSRFLGEHAPADSLRRSRDDPAGFDLGYWRKGSELGWTSLLVSEEHGGGSLSGRGLVDLSFVAHEFGAHAAPGPLITVNVVAAALSHAGSQLDVLGGLVAGDSIASWIADSGSVTVGLDGDDVAVNGAARAVESAVQADHLLVTGDGSDGITQVLVPTRTPGLSMTPMETVDLTRRFWRVRFQDVHVSGDAVVGAVGGAAPQVARQFDLALALANAEMVGCLQTAFDLTMEWAFDRYTFGRPLASYQELKHRFADMKTWLEASHAISDSATAAVQAQAPDAAEMVRIASIYVGDRGSELLQDCIQIHGGIGLTFDHDLHLYLRRHTLDRTLYGTPQEHRQRMGAVRP